MTTTTIYTVEFNGTTYTRRSEATYVYAAFRPATDIIGETAGKVTFHKSYGAAFRAAGRYGKVATAQHASAERTCVVCDGDGVITERTATAGMRTVPCYRCAR
jgi:hypothetical protein